ncbi:TetR/AcrR family transcriptional regulator [Rhodococcus opacus]|uniref:TetR/AcrR family transcriptional regulator n=1 Tax=Rhodococcus opacus TaxID=37919 RepID=UPI001C4812E8|nr:TetR/AcrR family transcriptional regulator [Rhodococcus opacus]MBV6754952.1 TetR/AcrR family transcriptional regulator [Rhodococcus opacus]
MNAPEDSSRTGTRERIPAVALKLFAEKGYDATSMREIAEQLNMTKAALYYHFDSKEDIVRVLVAGLLEQIVELVDWARSQQRGSDLRMEVLSRWHDIMQARGLALFRFAVANNRVFKEAGPDKLSMTRHLADLYDILTPTDATVEDRLRIRLALMSMNMAGIAANTIDASDDEILSAARKIASELMPGDLDHDSGVDGR